MNKFYSILCKALFTLLVFNGFSGLLFGQSKNIDLYHSDFSLSTSITSGGEYLYGNTTLINGGTDMAGSFSNAFYLSTDSILSPAMDSSSAGDILLSTTNVYSIPGLTSFRDSLFTQFPQGLPAGSYYILCVTDYRDEIQETNEDNNIVYAPIQVAAPFTDLFISNVKLPDSISVGSGFYLYYTDNNVGSSSAYNYTNGFYISTDPILDPSDQLVQTGYGYAPAGTASNLGIYFTVPNLPNGDYYLIVVDDINNNYQETDETNNTFSQPFRIVPPSVDLVAGEMSVNVPLTPGFQFNLTFTMENLGTVVANYHTTRFYLSNDPVLDGSDVVIGETQFYNVDPFIGSFPAWIMLNIPNTTVPGNYYIIEQEDANNDVPEINENNNTAILPITIVNPDVDLIVSAPSNPVNGYNGLVYYGNYSFGNAGSTYAGLTSIGVYLSKDLQVDDSDILITENYWGNVQNNYSIDLQFGYTIDPSLAPGSYYFLYVVDKNNTVAETNEANNLAYTPVTIQAPDIDLQITDLQIPDVLKESEYISFAYTFANNGSTPINYYSYVISGFYLSADTVYSWDDVNCAMDYYPGIAGQSSTTNSIQAYLSTNVPKGNYYLLAVIDPTNNFVESNETNNIIYKQVTVQGPDVDLSVPTVSLSNNVVLPGDFVQLNYTESNLGRIEAYGSYDVFYISADTIPSVEDYQVGAVYEYYFSSYGSVNQTSYFSVPNLPIGNYYLLVKADNYDYYSELNEANNVGYVKFRITGPYADLILRNATVSKTTIKLGESVSATVEDSNIGMSNADSPSVGFYISSDTIFDSNDNLLGYSSTGFLAPGDSNLNNLTYSLSNDVIPTNYYLLFVADPNNNVIENDENNNSTYLTINVINPDVNLMVSSVLVQPGAVVVGQNAQISNTIVNVGTDNSGDSYTGYYLSIDTLLDINADMLLQSSYISSLDAGSNFNQQVNVVFPGNVVPGNYYLLVAADMNHSQPEVNENDNVSYFAIKIKAKVIDLSLKSAILSSSKVSPGNSFVATVTLDNAGNSPVASSYLGYVLSTDKIYSSDDVLMQTVITDYLDVKESKQYASTLQMPANTIPGTYYILYLADFYNSISEADESNNMISKQIIVTIPTNSHAKENNGLFNEDSTNANFDALIINNPISNEARVKLSGVDTTQPVSVLLYDILGNEIYSSSALYANGVYSLNTEKLRSGVYMIQISQGSNLKTIRITKQ